MSRVTARTRADVQERRGHVLLRVERERDVQARVARLARQRVLAVGAGRVVAQLRDTP